MGGNVIQFPFLNSPTTPISEFIRLGDDGARALGDLFAQGHFRPAKVVVDASRFDKQTELINALRKRSVEIVLDTKAAELAALGRFSGRVQNAPWAAIGEGKILGPNFYHPSAKTSVIDEIARFAVSRSVDAVLAPTHWLNDPNFSDWLKTDFEACVRLRKALDREGGKTIAIDYTLISSHTFLQDNAERSEIVDRLRDAPFENLWIRASGIENNARPLTTRRHLEVLANFHVLEKPIIADFLGGMTGLALMSFGAASAICHGIGKFEGFDAGSWHKQADQRESTDNVHRSKQRISLPDINRSLTVKELEFLDKARGSRKHLACGDKSCCPNGWNDMLRDPRRHAVRQGQKQVASLAGVPDLKRPEHFLEQQLKPVEWRARQVAKLKPDAGADTENSGKIEKLMARLVKHADSLDKTYSALHNYREEFGNDLSRAKELRSRQVQTTLFDILGRQL